MFKANCTVFNRVFDINTREDQYVATHLHGVIWESCKGADSIKGGAKSNDNAVVYIPYTVGVNKVYRNPLYFEKDATGAFTLRPEDKLVKGIVEYEGNITKLSDAFDDVLTITSVDSMDFGSRDMHHWKVGGE